MLLLHRLPISWRLRKLNLLVASYLFYMAWSPPFVVLLWISTLVDWFIGRWLSKTESQPIRNLLLAASLIVNLGMLSYFKYANFILDNFISLAAMVGIAYQPRELDIVLPVGISFFTFQTLSYTFDIYRRKDKLCQSFLDYALFVTFFPQLVAGPIVRSTSFLPQCIEPKRANVSQMTWGLTLMVVGLFQKVCVADNLLAPITESVYDATGRSPDVWSAWVSTLAFSGQIYCDFAGYSTCAIGAALCLGFAIPDNFRFPYAASGFSDFWRRWHISLSSWLRDYLYISLGGNRKGSTRTSVNLMATMLIGGLWHGASWNFVIWGGLHGVYLSAERFIKWLAPELNRTTAILLRLPVIALTFVLTCFAWVYFRAPELVDALSIHKAMLCLPAPDATEMVNPARGMLAIAVVGSMLIWQFALRNTTYEHFMAKMPLAIRCLMIGAMMFAISISTGENRAFIYFQF